MEIVTGSTGHVHVTPIDDAVRNSNMAYLNEKVVFKVFEKFNAVDITANEVRVYSGYGMNQGRIFKIDEGDYDAVTIRNGSAGVKRMDLIVARYTFNQQTGVEDISLVVIEGAEGTDYTMPSYETGNINSGAIIDDFPLYKVKIDGIHVEHPEAMFKPLDDGGRVGEIVSRFNQHLLNPNNPHTVAWTVLNDTTEFVSGDNFAMLFSKCATAIKSYLAHVRNLNNPHAVKGSQLVGVVPIEKGGTGATTAQQAIENLGLPTEVADCASKTFFMGEEQTAVLVEKGGTGKTSHTSGRVLIGNGTGPLGERAIDTSPTADSTNLITSGAVKTAVNTLNTAIGKKMDTKTIDTTPKSGSSNLITSGAVYKAVPTFSLSGTTLTITTH